MSRLTLFTDASFEPRYKTGGWGLTMLYDPETTIATLAEQGMEGLEQFEEIFNAMPMMLGGLTQRGVMLAEEE